MSESNNQNTTQSKHEELTGVRAYALHNSFSGQPQIAASAQVAETARLRGNVVVGENVVIKDNVIIEGDVTIGEGCVIEPFCVIHGPSEIGSYNHFFQFCSIVTENREGCKCPAEKAEINLTVRFDSDRIRVSP